MDQSSGNTPSHPPGSTANGNDGTGDDSDPRGVIILPPRPENGTRAADSGNTATRFDSAIMAGIYLSTAEDHWRSLTIDVQRQVLWGMRQLLVEHILLGEINGATFDDIPRMRTLIRTAQQEVRDELGPRDRNNRLATIDRALRYANEGIAVADWVELNSKSREVFLSEMRREVDELAFEGKQHELPFQNLTGAYTTLDAAHNIIKDRPLTTAAAGFQEPVQEHGEDGYPEAYWPAPSYRRPQNPARINRNIAYWNVPEQWTPEECNRRRVEIFTDRNLASDRLPREAGQLISTRRPQFRNLAQTSTGSTTEQLRDIHGMPNNYPYQTIERWRENLHFVLGASQRDMVDRIQEVPKKKAGTGVGQRASAFNLKNNIIKRNAIYRRRKGGFLAEANSEPGSGNTGKTKGTTTQVTEIITGINPDNDKRTRPTLTDEQLLFRTHWDIDPWAGTMTQPGTNNTHPIPAPREVRGSALQQMMEGLGRPLPNLNWLYTQYDHLPRVNIDGPVTGHQVTARGSGRRRRPARRLREITIAAANYPADSAVKPQGSTSGSEGPGSRPESPTEDDTPNVHRPPIRNLARHLSEASLGVREISVRPLGTGRLDQPRRLPLRGPPPAIRIPMPARRQPSTQAQGQGQIGGQQPSASNDNLLSFRERVERETREDMEVRYRRERRRNPPDSEQ